MAVPTYEDLMLPLLKCLGGMNEAHVSDCLDPIAKQMGLTQQDREELLPTGKQTRFGNRVYWAKLYLSKAGLVESARRGYFRLSEAGKQFLEQSPQAVNNEVLSQFPEFVQWKEKSREGGNSAISEASPEDFSESTPDEVLRQAHKSITDALSVELLDRIRKSPPVFFERLLIDLLMAMGYGGTSEEAGRAIGQSGDDGVDGVIDQDPLGVDQIYIQAKRYAEGNSIGAGAIRDFFGALSLKKAHKGIFFTTSSFSPAAAQTAKDLGTRIVLIDGLQLAKLMIRYNIGCRDEEVLHLKKIDEDFFEV